MVVPSVMCGSELPDNSSGPTSCSFLSSASASSCFLSTATWWAKDEMSDQGVYKVRIPSCADIRLMPPSLQQIQLT